MGPMSAAHEAHGAHEAHEAHEAKRPMRHMRPTRPDEAHEVHAGSFALAHSVRIGPQRLRGAALQGLLFSAVIGLAFALPEQHKKLRFSTKNITTR